MKTKEEILNSYRTYEAEGAFEIIAADLLKAMEEYRQQAEEAAFNAARDGKTTDGVITYTYPTFAEYQASLTDTAPEDNLAATIQLIADSILEQFLPPDPEVKDLNFNIRTDGQSYKVQYVRNEQGYWYFTGYQLIQ